jgi:hypothetical protein
VPDGIVGESTLDVLSLFAVGAKDVVSPVEEEPTDIENGAFEEPPMG